ncbi:MAG: helix-turn-helix transcriptional regulator [Actinobacteria bacterium]|nr:helix-turn-helix transcriptional regulator [Actinomycetota bacterium]MBI3686957.1 helix-turn-helix transcriptional regulator [Actinomycetota bacterium]
MKLEIERAVVRAIETMRENLGEPLTIDDMARAAMYSKFHFSREFQRVTGISPRRFLSALRLQEAKRLLVSTSLTVTEISHRVGYTSVGTFSSRFASCVCLPPTTYRQLGGFATMIPADSCRRATAAQCTTIRGDVQESASSDLGLIFLGLFPSRIPQGRPVRCVILRRPGSFVLDEVPQGTWYLLAHSVPAYRHEVLTGDADLSVGFTGPISVRPNVSMLRVDLQLRPIRVMDPPVLMALLDVRKAVLEDGLATAAVG